MGTAEPDEAERVLSHAATCECCGDLLTASLISLEGTPSADEAAAIAQLAAAKTPWQTKLAQELAATKAQKPSLTQRLELLPSSFRQYSGHSRGRWLAMAGVAAALVAGVTFFAWQRHAGAPEHLLAMAYSQSRTLELRIPEAGYSPVVAGVHTRGAAADNESSPLLEARAGLARRLEGSPQNAHWLELQARADVLEERYDSATDVLDRLIAAGPVTAELLTDAAAAYYQRGLVSRSELDRSTALDYLRRADELAPTDPVILFNEAIVMEDRGQMMNAVEVWNRYITVERDERWVAEGRRKLAALEQTLNRLKSHQSRMRELLASPQAMDALAGDVKRLAGLDEELSSYELDTLLKSAFPGPAAGTAFDGTPFDGIAASGTTGQARGSPCASLCLAARRLLKATATSLELQHHDFWLSDLLSPDIDSLPTTSYFQLFQAMQLLAQATREDLSGDAAEGARMASQARTLFQRLKTEAGGYRASGTNGVDTSLSAAARAGDQRAAVEYMFALQRQVDFSDCRVFAEQLRTQPKFERESRSYPWIAAQELITEKICDDTPETRVAGRALQQESLRLAEAAGYPLMVARIRMREASDAQNAGDVETTERLTLATFRELITGDPPPLRVSGVIGYVPFVEQDSPRAHMAELGLRESVAWLELADDHTHGAGVRMELARAEMRIGAMTEAENQLRQAYAEGSPSGLGKSKGTNFSLSETVLAESMLERGDREGAERFLNQAAAYMANNSDTWYLRRYASVQGQLALSRQHYDVAAQALESDIRSSEGKDVRGGDRATAAEYAQQDHDLYAELAATWLAQGRSPESVLALWERFRLRSRGLPIAQCHGDALDCEQPLLLAEQHRLGSSLLIGQVMLLDRMLIYRVDRNTVSWSEKAVRRRDILDAAQTLERAVSSPYSSSETAAKLGTNLSNALLPQLPASLNPDAVLLLEPDPMLQNLSWPVLPTQVGALGLQYPLAEVRSILTFSSNREGGRNSGFLDGGSALVIGASVAAEGEPPLPEAMKEASSVNAFLHSPDLLLGEQATAIRVGAALGTATIFHFAGHALQTGNGTELLLAATSPGEKRPWVDGEFLRRHPPRACRLAVLSACATGVREAAWNHPLQDIVETLGSLGVPEVVATRWRIDSSAAIPFMDAFYQSLAQGTSVAMALTSARRVESEKSLYASPYYWGAYYATGRETTRLTGEFHASLEKQAKGKEKRF
jgi:CHAT domain-containing protein